MPPHPDRSIIEGEVGTGEVGIVEEPMEVVVVVDATFDRPCLFIHAPRNECQPEVDVMWKENQIRQCIMALEELVYHLDYGTKAREADLCRLDKVSMA